MSASPVLLSLCLAFFLQGVYSQITKAGIAGPSVGLSNAGINSIGLGNAGFTSASIGNGFGIGNRPAGVPDVAAAAAIPVTGAYGGTGLGDLEVGGEFAASGKAVVTGQVPVLGSVSFSGSIPASGIVSLAGNCGCANVQL